MQQQNIGARLRWHRLEHGRTPSDLSVTARVPLATIEEIENGGADTSFDILLKLCRALDLPVESLIGGNVPVSSAAGRILTRENDWAILQTAQYSYRVHSSNLLDRRMTPVHITVHARRIDGHTLWSRHEGEQVIFVVRGKIQFYCDTHVPCRLRAGESAYFDSSLRHTMISLSRKDAVVLSVYANPASQT